MYLEFVTFEVEAEDWFYQRYCEIRKLVKAALKVTP
jgi:hypothetical protein